MYSYFPLPSLYIDEYSTFTFAKKEKLDLRYTVLDITDPLRYTFSFKRECIL